MLPVDDRDLAGSQRIVELMGLDDLPGPLVKCRGAFLVIEQIAEIRSVRDQEIVVIFEIAVGCGGLKTDDRWNLLDGV